MNGFNPDSTMWQVATVIIPLVIAIVFHEVSHGLVARMFGDPTAHEQRRLSLNPIRHVDPVGTLLVPGFLWLTTHTAFGWAKPVPVDARRLRNPRRDMMFVAAAGPGSNIVLALAGAIGLGLLVRAVGPADPGMTALFLRDNMANFIAINLFLAFFNLLPIPPFDGSHIVEGLLPRDAARAYARTRQAGFAIILILLFVVPWLIPGFDLIGAVVIPPVQWLFNHFLQVTQAVSGVRIT
ncbi:site-2 protease family protein [Novosphingobium sp. ZN18A2]|uniref:site-2 protease family protein n=1 Tax=Novosphingobium sp. ZN18A2 TaxID=3079861 RepID=UPI0030CCEC36